MNKTLLIVIFIFGFFELALAQRYPPTSGVTSVGTFGSTPNANGASISGSVITMQPANSTHPGELTAADWNTFNNKQPTLTTGNLIDAGTDGIVVTGGTGAVIGSGTSLAQHVADTTHNGYLLSTDWNTFNGKQVSGSYITALTGDVTATGPNSVAATLATVNSNVGSFGSTTSIPSFTVNGKGLITAASSNAVVTVPAASTYSAWDANKNLSANNQIASYSTTATAAGTTTLSISSARQQYFTGSNTQIVKLPDATTLAAGFSMEVTNLSTNLGGVTINNNAGTKLAALANGSLAKITCTGTGSAAGTWYINVTGGGTYTPTNVGSNVNVGTPTFQVTNYSQTNAQITVSGFLQVTPTAATTSTSFSISLPLNFASLTQVELNGGSTTDGGGSAAKTAVAIRGDSGAQAAQFNYSSPTNTTSNVTFIFQYQAY